MSGSKLSDASLPPIASAPRPESLDEPLGLTVHSMPVPQPSIEDAQRTARGRRMMFIVMLICAAPMVASYFTYYVIRPTGRPDFGALITPQRPIPEVAATTLAGRSVPLRSLKNRWLLLSVADGACDSSCVQRLYLQHQLRATLGKDRYRVDWVWLVDDDAPVPAKLLPALKDAVVLRVPAATLAKWLPPAPGHALTEHLYVVDPMGHLMMRFPANLDVPGAAKARSDLVRLLKASESWDTDGRE
ncbi:MAG: hypothetical protein ACREWJ_08205 [Rhodoferax sp.]